MENSNNYYYNDYQQNDDGYAHPLPRVPLQWLCTLQSYSSSLDMFYSPCNLKEKYIYMCVIIWLISSTVKLFSCVPNIPVSQYCPASHLGTRPKQPYQEISIHTSKNNIRKITHESSVWHLDKSQFWLYLERNKVLDRINWEKMLIEKTPDVERAISFQCLELHRDAPGSLLWYLKSVFQSHTFLLEIIIT